MQSSPHVGLSRRLTIKRESLSARVNVRFYRLGAWDGDRVILDSSAKPAAHKARTNMSFDQGPDSGGFYHKMKMIPRSDHCSVNIGDVVVVTGNYPEVNTVNM